MCFVVSLKSLKSKGHRENTCPSFQINTRTSLIVPNKTPSHRACPSWRVTSADPCRTLRGKSHHGECTCRLSIFSLTTDTKGRMKIAFLFVSTTCLNISSSATMVLPALVGAEYTRFPPPDMRTQNASGCLENRPLPQLSSIGGQS